MTIGQIDNVSPIRLDTKLRLTKIILMKGQIFRLGQDSLTTT